MLLPFLYSSISNFFAKVKKKNFNAMLYLTRNTMRASSAHKQLQNAITTQQE